MGPEAEKQLAALAAAHGLDEATIEALRTWAEGLLATTLDPAGRETVLGETLAVAGGTTELPAHTERFEFRASLGAGGMGAVWRVWDRGLRRNLAMKTMRGDASPETVQARFVAEAQLTGQLRHPAIVPVHELGRLPDGRVYYTMREVRGTTLETLVRELHSSPEAWSGTERGDTCRSLIALVAEACEAVGYAHTRGVVHRDLKPQNLMRGEFGEVQVIDWGVAKAIGTAEEPVHTARDEVEDVTRLGDVVGTPAFMAPEQAYGWNDRVDARSDVYALGSVLYTVVSGHPPYEPLPGRPVLSQVLEGPPDPLVDDRISLALLRIIERAMSREHTERFADANELHAALTVL